MDHTNSEALGILLLEQLKEGIIMTDENGVMIFVNSAAEQIRNVKRETLIGNNVIDCHSPQSRENVVRAIEHLKRNPKVSLQRMVTDHRNRKIYENTYTSICDDMERLQGIAVITRDITEKVQTEEAKLNYTRSQEMAIEGLKMQCHKLLMGSMETLINVLEARDQYTNGHSKRVSDITMKLYTHKCGMNNYYIDLQNASKLHDIGKVGIPDHLIEKPGRLTAEEFDIVKQHSVIAADIIRPIDPDNHISSIILHHHDRYDGKGYPGRLAGDEIPLGARIIAIADSYDAMSSDRPYRNALPFDACVREIAENSGKQFDPAWVEVFMDLAETGGI